MDTAELLDQIAALPEPKRRAALRKLQDRGIDLRSLRPPRRALDRAVPLSPQQADLWTYETLYPGAALNLCGAYWFGEPVDDVVLGDALEELVTRHPVLRSRFVFAEIGLEQRPEQRALQLERIDVGQDQSRVRPLIQDHASRPFDLAAGLPVRARLITGDAVGHGVLVLAFHHIVTDWWTFDLLHGELSVIYAARLAGRQPSLDPAPDYADFAAWHDDLATIGAYREDEQFWARYLAEAPEVPLPATGRSATAERIDVDYGAEAFDGLSRFARDHGVSTFAAGFAVFAAFLHRQVGATDIVVGTPSANRDQPGTERLVGYVMNMVPVRVSVDGGDTLAQTAASISASAAEALAHGRLPLGRITASANPVRTQGQAPAFQVVYMYLPEQLTATALPGRARFERVHTGDEENGFVVILRESAGHLTATFEFRSDVLDPEIARCWAVPFGRLLEALNSESETPLAAIDALTDGERADVLRLGEGPRIARPDSILPDLVSGHDPGTPALAYGDEVLSYGELNLRAARLAEALRRRGVGKGSRVGTRMQRSTPAHFVALLAVLRAGAAYVALDPSYPQARLDFMIADSGVSLVLDETLLPDGPVGQGPQVDADAEIDADAPAYLIYTSGSTGTPKGVLVSHRSAVNLALTQVEAWRLTNADRVLQFASLSFDASVEEIWTAWASGACLVLSPPSVDGSAHSFLRFVAEAGITVLDLPTAFWSILATEPDAMLPGSVHTVVIGGEPYPAAALSAWFVHHPDLRLINTYGPTESTVTATATELSPSDCGHQVIGAPLANVTVRVLDSAGRLVGVGVVGELHIGGAGVAIGYLDRPELTASRFVTYQGERVYRTGDLVAMRPDGRLLFHGRVDDQVKLRGYRVEPGEVESVVAGHPEVRAAAVVVDGTGADGRLVAHLMTTTGEVPTGLREWSAARLPAHMVPAVFLLLAELPLSPSGKLDRKALPAPAGQRRSTTDYVAARTPLERAVAAIWSEILDVDPVSAHDDFFMLGGTSLQAIRAIGELERRTGVALPAAQVFSHPTVAGLATLAEFAAGQVHPQPVGRRDGGAGQWPLSAAQAGLWYLSQVEDVGAAYSIVECLLAGPDLDTARLERCVKQVAARHDALRTTFASTELGLVQRVEDALVPQFDRLATVSVSDLPAMLRQVAEVPFDLLHGPLVRLTTARVTDGRWAVILSVHHIVADGISLGVLLGEVEALYNGRVLPERPLQLPDFAVWQHERDLSDGLAYWTEALRGAPELTELPWDQPRPARQRGAGATLRTTIDAARTARVATLASQWGITPFCVYLSAFQVLLSRLSGQLDVVTGLPVAGRTRPEFDRTVGLFVNTVPLRTRLAATATFRDLALQVGRTLGQTLRHQDVPLDRIVAALAPRRSLAHHPMFQTVFSWNESPEQLAFDGVPATPLPLELPVAKFDFGLALQPNGDGSLSAAFEFRTDLLERDTVGRWAELYRFLLATLTGDPDCPVSSAPMHSSEDAAAVMALGAGPRLDVAYETAHGIVEHQARATPDAPALRIDGQLWTYAELDRLADGFATRLRGAGVELGERVGIRLERSVYLYAAVLAVLKAGAVYVPLDPEYPQPRIDFMIADSGLRVVLDQAWLEGTGPQQALPRVRSTADAYICYTSGSTGTPKGAVIAHGGVASMAVALRTVFELRAEDRMLQFASLSFDASVLEMFATWAAGACLVAIRADRRTGAPLRQALRDDRITAVLLPPSVTRDLDPRELPELRLLVTGGEPCPPELIERWGASCRLINAYGPTEATVCATTAVLRPADRIVVGRPIGNVRVQVTDTDGQVVPVGVVGEVRIGGRGVGHGSLNRPELTARAFADGCYRTGDLGRMRPEGNVELLGRLDDQVKVNGFRIELGEVEAAATEHPDVVQSVATVRSGKLVLHLLTVDGTVPRGLRGWLAQRVPAYLVPSVMQPIASVPLTPAGKVDRRSLPEPDTNRPDLDVDYVAPRDELERRIARVWADALNVSRVGVHDNIFELGADSLQLVGLASRLEADGLPCSIVSLYVHQTIEELAAGVRDLGADDA